MERTGLKVTDQQRELARALGRPRPVSRAALLEWKSGVVPVPMEAFDAACDLARADPLEVMRQAAAELAHAAEGEQRQASTG